MTKRTLAGLALAPAALLFTGCLGTAFNLAGDGPQVYGGVRKDWQLVCAPDSVVPPDSALRQGRPPGLACRLVGALDLPLSAVGDTLTLPLTVSCALAGPVRDGAASPAQPSPPGAAPTSGSPTPPRAGERP